MSTWRPATRLPTWLRWLPGWTRTPLKWLLRLFLLGAVAAVGLALFYFYLASEFDLDRVAELPARTVILDREGGEIEAGFGASRRLARRQDLPPFLVECLEAREDARFYDHCGVDFRGLARATKRNLQDRDFTQGASTLTMQLARNTYEMRAKSIHRKLLEIALTLRIEQRYSKDEILAHYLNRIYFGSGCHGIEEASQTYFGKPVNELHEGESALLVGIIRGPHLFSPIRNLEGALAQQREVLSRLVAVGRIDEAEKRRIEAVPIRLLPDEQRTPERSYAIRAIRAELEDILEAQDIRLDGLVVHTTLDASWQLRLETDLSETLLTTEAGEGWEHPTHRDHQPGTPPAYLQCAAVTLESDTGGILALIGGRDFLDSRFDRSTGARRDLGGAFEPWIAAAASERGRRVLPGNPLLTGRQLGPLETARIARRCGIGGPFLETEDLFRGSAAASPMELATALATLSNAGKRPKPFLVNRIHDAGGTELYRRRPEFSQAITRAAAEEACSLLESRHGTRCHTGTTGSGRDAWMLRVGPSGSTVVWLGFDDPKRISSNPHLDRVLGQLVKRLGN